MLILTEIRLILVNKELGLSNGVVEMKEVL